MEREPEEGGLKANQACLTTLFSNQNMDQMHQGRR